MVKSRKERGAAPTFLFGHATNHSSRGALTWTASGVWTRHRAIWKRSTDLISTISERQRDKMSSEFRVVEHRAGESHQHSGSTSQRFLMRFRKFVAQNDDHAERQSRRSAICLRRCQRDGKSGLPCDAEQSRRSPKPRRRLHLHSM